MISQVQPTESMITEDLLKNATFINADNETIRELHRVPVCFSGPDNLNEFDSGVIATQEDSILDPLLSEGFIGNLFDINIFHPLTSHNVHSDVSDSTAAGPYTTPRTWNPDDINFNHFNSPCIPCIQYQSQQKKMLVQSVLPVFIKSAPNAPGGATVRGIQSVWRAGAPRQKYPRFHPDKLGSWNYWRGIHSFLKSTTSMQTWKVWNTLRLSITLILLYLHFRANQHIWVQNISKDSPRGSARLHPSGHKDSQLNACSTYTSPIKPLRHRRTQYWDTRTDSTVVST